MLCGGTMQGMTHHRNPKALLTPAMHSVLDRMARAGHAPLHALNPVQARAAYAAGAGVLELPVQGLPRVEDHQFVARDGAPIAVRLYASSASHSGSPLPVLVYFHGGGFTIGSIETHDGLCRRLAHLAQCAVVSVEYRLAPEHVFPTAVNDAWDAVRWLADTGATLGLDPSRMAVGGDSAGGTLASVCAILARDHGLSLVLQLLFYPGTAAHANSDSHRRFGKGFVLEDSHIAYFFGHYLPRLQDYEDWRFAPLDGRVDGRNLVDVSDLAPAWFGLAECDPLVDEGLAYADRLRMAGVPVDLEMYRGVVHEFIKMGRAIPEAKRAHADAARVLTNAFTNALTVV